MTTFCTHNTCAPYPTPAQLYVAHTKSGSTSYTEDPARTFFRARDPETAAERMERKRCPPTPDSSELTFVTNTGLGPPAARATGAFSAGTGLWLRSGEAAEAILKICSPTSLKSRGNQRWLEQRPRGCPGPCSHHKGHPRGAGPQLQAPRGPGRKKQGPARLP